MSDETTAGADPEMDSPTQYWEREIGEAATDLEPGAEVDTDPALDNPELDANATNTVLARFAVEDGIVEAPATTPRNYDWVLENKPKANQLSPKNFLIILAAIGAVGLCLCIGALIAVQFVPDDFQAGFREGFGEVMEDMGGMFARQQELITQYPAGGYNVTVINGNRLKVSFTNPSFISLSTSSTQQKSTAREIATFIKSHYGDIELIDHIVIEFKKESGSVFTIYQTASFNFPIDELPDE